MTKTSECSCIDQEPRAEEPELQSPFNDALSESITKLSLDSPLVPPYSLCAELFRKEVVAVRPKRS